MSDFEDDEVQVGFARKYRPDTLEGYIGNTKMKQSMFLKLDALTRDHVAFDQGVLITGTTGCGKTTAARILIRELQCTDRRVGVGACGECTSCTSLEDYILTGNTDGIYDIYEVDVADKSSKSSLDAIKNEASTPPFMNKYKIFIWDEYHRASTAAQSGMLKIFEEPEEYVINIVLTTDPDMILETIKNRCPLKMVVAKPTVTEIVAHLATICQIEGVPYDNEGLRMLSNRAGRVVREALNNLQHMATTRKTALAEDVVLEFDEIKDSLMNEFLQSYKDREYIKYSCMLYNIVNSRSPETFLTALNSFVTRGIYVANGAELEGLTSKEIEDYKRLFLQFSPAELAVILSNMRKMSLGDIETNLLAFIYDEPVTRVPSSPSSSGSGLTELLDGSTGKESKARSGNMDALRAASRAKGEDVLLSATREVSEKDILAELGNQLVHL